jgi:hypothetical protein
MFNDSKSGMSGKPHGSSVHTDDDEKRATRFFFIFFILKTALCHIRGCRWLKKKGHEGFFFLAAVNPYLTSQTATSCKVGVGI